MRHPNHVDAPHHSELAEMQLGLFNDSILNTGKLKAIPELFTESFRDHNPLRRPLFLRASKGDCGDRNDIERFVSFLGRPNVEMHFSIEEMIASRDRIGYRLFGIGSILAPIAGGPSVDSIVSFAHEANSDASSIVLVLGRTSQGKPVRVLATLDESVLRSSDAGPSDTPPPPLVNQEVAAEIVYSSGLERSVPIAIEFQLTYNCTGLFHFQGPRFADRWGIQEFRA